MMFKGEEFESYTPHNGAIKYDMIDEFHASDAQKIEKYLHARRARLKYLPESLLSDPAWDILLDLFVARARDKKVCISSACVAAGVPTTTALRWISTLESHNLVSREPDPFDKRRTILSLTDHGYNIIGAWLHSSPSHCLFG